ncbi:PQQ-dependent sugar dehydrogenase [Aquimarina sp. U1-2]|uniref:PQQ-dependent sugar dehydrogenase n=1 Tax=Aquimarina sp. U1-2 TaxID=2823141 RepID=UPI001AED0C66|nr:PQQ-dependent sugar dehydrogenase [Aquimarina sp. U1-2]MBP2832373.1 PQQ-dependent sugar dehydrogenase [Aquimarina sp. U1-2]
MRIILCLSLVIATFSACAQEKKENDVVLEPDPKNYTTELVVQDLQIPWGMAWLPDGSMLITEKSGALIHFKNGNKKSIGNVPEVYVRNQGGLLDIELHPQYEKNGWIYITYSSKDGAEKGGNTALIRAKLANDQLIDIETLYKGTPNTTKGHHFGSRIEFDNEGYVYFCIGDRGNRDVNPQDVTKDGGKIYRLHDDGSIPKDNPFIQTENAKKAIYSYGHRNPQGMALHPNGTIWVHEHGPRGGDEINPIQKGINYGWPVITYGINYSGTQITALTKKEGMQQPLYYWIPSIAPSGMDFVTSDIYPDWKNDIVIGSLKFQYLELVELTDQKVSGRKKLLEDIGRVRNVRQGPDGFIYVAVENKGILKIVPKT